MTNSTVKYVRLSSVGVVLEYFVDNSIRVTFKHIDDLEQLTPSDLSELAMRGRDGPELNFLEHESNSRIPGGGD